MPGHFRAIQLICIHNAITKIAMVTVLRFARGYNKKSQLFENLELFDQSRNEDREIFVCTQKIIPAVNFYLRRLINFQTSYVSVSFKR